MKLPVLYCSIKIFSSKVLQWQIVSLPIRSILARSSKIIPQTILKLWRQYYKWHKYWRFLSKKNVKKEDNFDHLIRIDKANLQEFNMLAVFLFILHLFIYVLPPYSTTKRAFLIPGILCVESYLLQKIWWLWLLMMTSLWLTCWQTFYLKCCSGWSITIRMPVMMIYNQWD